MIIDFCEREIEEFNEKLELCLKEGIDKKFKYMTLENKTELFQQNPDFMCFKQKYDVKYYNEKPIIKNGLLYYLEKNKVIVC